MSGEPQFLAIAAEPDEDRRWDFVTAWVTSDPFRARRAAEAELDSDDARSREAAADVLGQVATVDREAASRIAETLLPRLGLEQDRAVVASLIFALGHTYDHRAHPELLRHAAHPSENVRLAVAVALPSLELNEDSLEALRRLSVDVDEDVRDWATFGLANSDARDQATVEALAARADDTDDDTRAEALFGLARRKDPRARALIDRELARPDHGSLIEEAAAELEA